MRLAANNNFSISTWSVVKVVLALFVLWLVFLLKQEVLIFFVAIVIASAIEPITRKLKRFHIPRAFSVILVYLVALAVVAVVVYFFIPPIVQEVSNISIALPGYLQNVTIPGADSAGTFAASDLLESFRTWLTSFSSGTLSALLRFFGGAFSFFLIFIISFYLAVQEKGIENFLRVVTPAHSEARMIDLWQRFERKIGYWFQGQIALMLIVGVLVFVGLSLIKMKFALTLAILAALFEIIPIFGPIFSAVPAVLIAFSISPTLGFITVGLYLVIQWTENHIIYPVVVNKLVGVPSIVVILAITAGGALAGFLGVVLAVPTAALLLEIFHDLEKQKHNDLLSPAP